MMLHDVQVSRVLDPLLLVLVFLSKGDSYFSLKCHGKYMLNLEVTLFVTCPFIMLILSSPGDPRGLKR
jgi:hypothetical protein